MRSRLTPLERKRLKRAEEIAVSLMRKHNLKGWEFGWMPHAEVRDTSVWSSSRGGYTGAYGKCGLSYILLNPNAVRINSLAVTRQVVLHEIAHALVPFQRRMKVDHGKEFVKTARKIGCTRYKSMVKCKLHKELKPYKRRSIHVL